MLSMYIILVELDASEVCYWLFFNGADGTVTLIMLLDYSAAGRLKMREWKMRYGQKCKGGKCRSSLAVWKAEPI